MAAGTGVIIGVVAGLALAFGGKRKKKGKGKGTDLPAPSLEPPGTLPPVVGPGDLPPFGPSGGGQPVPGSTPQLRAEVIAALTSPVPRTGAFVKATSAGLSKMVKAALNDAKPGAGENKDNRNAYITALIASPWNRELYGTQNDTSNKYPAIYTRDGWGLRQAFLPKNEDAAAVYVAEGRIPKRSVSLTGEKIGPGNKHGLLYFPPVDEDALPGFVVIPDGNWPDSTIPHLDPPPEYWDNLLS